MKKLIVTIMCLALFAVAAMPAAAQGRYRRSRVVYAQQQRPYDSRRGYYDYGYRDNRTFWEKHRDKLTTAMGVGGGAMLGGIIGGGRGAGIGAIAGGAGSAIYTYKIRNRHRYPY
jgi:L-aminopeptidase/D-esterase-like protein